MARNYLTGKFVPKNPKKYVGDVNNIRFRSGWERKLMLFLDDNPSVLKWGSEEIQIPYISPVDNQPHIYFPDFMVVVKTADGEKKMMIEIKPLKECKLPEGNRKTKQLTEAIKTYAVNQAKWAAATKWCTARGIDFKVMTEKDLGITR